MLSGKNIGYIALLAIAGVLIYCFFFKKKVAVEKLTEVKSVPEKPQINISDYVGPQDCAENCEYPYSNMIVSCYDHHNGSQECLNKAEAFKQDCLAKCDKSLPRYLDINQEVATPIQENNYFSNLFLQGYV